MTRHLLLLTLALALAGCKPAAPEADKPAEPEAEAPDTRGLVTMTPEAQRDSGVKVAPIATRRITEALTATGEFEANADAEAHVSPRVAGRVVKLVKTVGDRVRRGDTLAVIESLELGQAEAGYLEAQARVALGRSTLERQRKLFANDLTAKKELLAAENELRLQEIALESAHNQLVLFGLGEAQLRALASRRRIDALSVVTAPTSGVITAKHATLGERLAPDAPEPAFVLADHRELWVNANLYERDLAKVHVGQDAAVTTPAYPGRTYQGRVSLISTAMDKDTRTATARVVVANADGRLKPEMFATIAIGLGHQQALAVPASAVMRLKNEIFTFVQKGPDQFEKRDVTVGPPADGYCRVLTGLAAGEKVAVDGGVTLKAEWLKSSFGGEE
jgi:cobalt-zinc-cadmium efflux system membrane fusion protein